MKKENIKIDVKKVSIESLIRKEKYIDQFKDLVLESKKIGKVRFGTEEMGRLNDALKVQLGLDGD